MGRTFSALMPIPAIWSGTSEIGRIGPFGVRQRGIRRQSDEYAETNLSTGKGNRARQQQGSEKGLLKQAFCAEPREGGLPVKGRADRQ